MEDERNEQVESAVFAFISLKRMEEDAEVYQGAALVTDIRCKPLEFRCTSPVRPNAVQRTLYGQTLVPHIAVDLMSLPLLNAVQKKPDLILVRDEVFIEVRSKISYPLLHVRRQGESIKLERPGGRKDTSVESSILDAVSARYEPIVVTPHWDYQEDLAENRDKLRAAFAYADILEPFDRISVALDEVYAKKEFEE